MLQECLFCTEFSHVSSYLEGCHTINRIAGWNSVFFLTFVIDFHIIPQKDCVHLKVSPVNRASWPLAPALMDGYHLNTSRQKSSWLYLYFLSCYGDGILFFPVFINQISFWWIISSFPSRLCSTYFCYGLYEGLASIKMLAIFFFNQQCLFY